MKIIDNIKNAKSVRKLQYLLIGVNILLLAVIAVMLPEFISLKEQLDEYDINISDLEPISSSDSANDITVIENVDFPYIKVYSKNDTSTPRVAARGIWDSYILGLLEMGDESGISYMYIEELTILAEGDNEFVFELRLNPKIIPDEAEIISQTGKSASQLRFGQRFRVRFDAEEHQYYLAEIGGNMDYSDLPPYDGGAK